MSLKETAKKIERTIDALFKKPMTDKTKQWAIRLLERKLAEFKNEGSGM